MAEMQLSNELVAARAYAERETAKIRRLTDPWRQGSQLPVAGRRMGRYHHVTRAADADHAGRPWPQISGHAGYFGTSIPRIITFPVG
jgi:hypothetical protein